MNAGQLDDGLAVAVIDALTSQICVLNNDGVIVAVNEAWKAFAAENSGGRAQNHIGVNYLNLCQYSAGPAADEAPNFFKGLRAVLRGEREFFQLEYPCHSPKELRWFVARVSRLRRRSGATQGAGLGAVVSHMNITDRKQIELNLARLAATDPLTGLPNRRFFDDLAKLEMDRFISFGEPSSVLIVDLDHFKSINDSHGHAAGDEVLRRVASTATALFRSCDLFARYGGEEFVCLLPGTDGWGAVMAAEKLRLAVEGLSIVFDNKTIRVTTSVGAACFEAGETTVDHALQRADKALYKAKRDGRNCVRILERGSQADATAQPLAMIGRSSR